MSLYYLGRLPSEDERDNNFPMKALLPQIQVRPLVRYWNDNGWWGNQGQTSQCVAYAWTHWLEDGPVTHKGPAPIIQPNDLYHEAQKNDEWPGENYDGTSVRAGAKVLHKSGLIDSYHWANDVETIANALLTLGPVVVGTDWYSGMFQPSADEIKISGVLVGGHAYVLNGINLKRGLVRMKNSWGREWAGDGRAWMSLETLEKLILEGGEACIAVEVRK